MATPSPFLTLGISLLLTYTLRLGRLTLTIFCYISGRWDWTSYLLLPHVPAASEMAVVGGALVGVS